ncbi:uncharacterized protein PGRI_023250 [Penicillium griseofulvum]|uniref:Uncharacterized protein n=1 Tax=Penicillium patulum TaxID=5078 RepID=A0A135LHL2_PENPA|nr:uncharacterized protein PGRI_023250 [Penicillium griseofulvum]KXG48455.1 hypothetical protein PGRI_023250 [Penicillium griseofulvum]
MCEHPFPVPSDNYEYMMKIVGFVEDLPVGWESKLEELRFISEQNATLKKVRVTDYGSAEKPKPTDCTRSDALALADVRRDTNPVSRQGAPSAIASSPRLREAFVKKANNPMLAPLLSIMEVFLLFRPSDRSSLVTVTKLEESVLFESLDEHLSLAVDAAEGEEEFPNNDALSHLQLTGVQEADEQAGLEAPARTSESLVGHESEPAQELEVCQNNEKSQFAAQTGTSDHPTNPLEPQPVSPEISENLEQEQLEVADGAKDPLHVQGEQQPDVSDICHVVEESQSEVQSGTPELQTSDLQNDQHDRKPAPPEIVSGLEQDQLKGLDRTPDLVDIQEEQQPEISEIPEGSNSSQLEIMEDLAAASEDGREQKPGRRKRLRSHLGELLNRSWKPWKRRRKP